MASKKKTTKKPATDNAGDNKAKIDAALKELRAATNSGDKKRIRRKLRALGHTGGLKASGG